MKQCEVRTFLPAFADGELDVEQNLRVLEAMAMDPTHTRRVLHQQQLRKACAKAMDRPDCRCPEELRKQIASLCSIPHAPHADTEPNLSGLGGGDEAPGFPRDTHERSPILARIGRWAPAAVAAVLLIGALVVFFASANSATAPLGVADARLAKFTSQHKACASDVTRLRPGVENPSNVEQLPGTIDDYFGDGGGSIEAGLDLSSLGYRFERVGACSIPGKNAVHIMYKADDPAGGERSLSLWIKPDGEGLNLEPGRVYTADADNGQPLVVWQRLGRMYYLFADMPDDARRAAHMLAHK